MKQSWLAVGVLFASAVAAVYAAAPAAAQSASPGALEFEAQVAPVGSQPEPVRQLSFYLLRKSLTQIQGEVAQSDPAPDLNAFIDTLDVSANLKAWMKKTHTVEFAGLAFTKILTPDDVIDIPEFFEAYKNLNGAILNAKLPAPQIKDGEEQKNPEKYQREKEKYKKELQQYIKGNPQLLDGLDAELTDRTFGRQWAQLLADRKRHDDQRALILAQTQYLAAKTDSDLAGRGEFRGLPPGSYWITTLNVPALAGQDRLQWDLRVTVRPGETSRIELSNLNALPSSDPLR